MQGAGVHGNSAFLCSEARTILKSLLKGNIGKEVGIQGRGGGVRKHK